MKDVANNRLGLRSAHPTQPRPLCLRDAPLNCQKFLPDPPSVKRPLFRGEIALSGNVPLGPGVRHIITIVAYSTFRRWVRKATCQGTAGSKRRSQISMCIRELVVRIARETGCGYSRILGELKKLRLGRISRQTVKNILKENGLDPRPRRGGRRCLTPTGPRRRPQGYRRERAASRPLPSAAL